MKVYSPRPEDGYAWLAAASESQEMVLYEEIKTIVEGECFSGSRTPVRFGSLPKGPTLQGTGLSHFGTRLIFIGDSVLDKVSNACSGNIEVKDFHLTSGEVFYVIIPPFVQAKISFTSPKSREDVTSSWFNKVIISSSASLPSIFRISTFPTDIFLLSSGVEKLLTAGLTGVAFDECGECIRPI